MKEQLRRSLLASQKNFCSNEELQSWFDPLIIKHSEHPPSIYVTFPHRFFGSWFANTFQKIFEETSYELWGYGVNFYYNEVITKEPLYYPTKQNKSTQPIKISQHFDNFIVNGKHSWIISIIENILCSVSENILNNTSEEVTQLLVLFGKQTTGKTHLLRAIANELSKIPSCFFKYTTTDELAFSLNKEPLFLFREHIQSHHLILIDDFQRVPSYPELQLELTILLDYYKDNKKILIISGTDHPLTWNVSKEIYSRLEVGLWGELPEPDLDIRFRYAQQLSKEKKYILPKEQLLIISQHCHSLRCLSGILHRTIAHKTLLNRELSEKELITLIKQTGEITSISPQLIIMLVGECYGFSASDIISENRQQQLVLARQIAMYLCRELLGYSYPAIGRLFGGRDHTTVLHSVKKIALLQDNDRVVHTMIHELIQKCKNVKNDKR